MLRVIRLGGSLLTWPQLAIGFHDWLAVQPPGCNILVAGGGPWVELLRQSAIRFDLTEEAAHWTCVRAMSTTAQLTASILDLPLITDANVNEALHWQTACSIVLDTYNALRLDAERRPQESLPTSWQVTSDSIAAWLAIHVGADELVLLKSAAPPSHLHSAESLAAIGYVDAHFPTLAPDIPAVRYVNLRGS